MTQISSAQRGETTDQMRYIAKEEPITLSRLQNGVAKGKIVIPWNPNHHPTPVGIGQGLRVKVNANIGTSREHCKPEEEIQKAKASLQAKVHAIMDLSTGGNLDEIRKKLLKVSTVPFGTVPIYQTGIQAVEKHGAIIDMTSDEMFNIFERQAKQGVDFAVVHVGVNQESVERLKRQKRLIPMVSRGGAFHMAWILHHEQENPLYKEFDHLLDLAKEYDVTLSLGDGMRSGALADSNDRAKFQEMLIIGELVERARKAGVQTMVEGPGHMPLNDIQSNIEVMKVVTKHAPYFVLGPLVTDIAPGYDHFVGGIGGALAGYFGADFLCYLTPAEHLALPDVDDVREGVIAARIAAHAADLARGIDRNIDYEFSTARENLDWDKMFDLAVDNQKPKLYRKQRKPLEDTHACTMCGNLCAIEIVEKYLKKHE
jgi:phosphomethylpyrimidine synthase